MTMQLQARIEAAFEARGQLTADGIDASARSIRTAGTSPCASGKPPPSRYSRNRFSTSDRTAEVQRRASCAGSSPR